MGAATTTLATVSIEEFWGWLKMHFNCIVRVGGPGFTLFDAPDLHWRIAEEDEFLIAQGYRGKEIVGEMVLSPQDVTYVQAAEEEGDNTIFECISTLPEGQISIAYFLMSHGLDEEREEPSARWTH